MCDFANNEKLYKGHYFFAFYEYDDETIYDFIPNVYEIVKKLKQLKQFPLMPETDVDGKTKFVDVNDKPITRKEVAKISHYVYKCLRKKTHLCTLFGRTLRIYLVDNDDDEDTI